MTASDFYARRDRRTEQYGGRVEALKRPVALVVGLDAAACRAGQVAALALVNMAARVHRRIDLVVPHAPLLAQGLFRRATLTDELLATASAIDPFGEFEQTGTVPDDRVTLGLGQALPGLGWYASVSHATTRVNTVPAPFVGDCDGSILAAQLAACLSAAHLFKQAHCLPVGPSTVSVWDLADGEADSAPVDTGPLDVGDVAVIGAGAVAGALGYWAREFFPKGNWTYVDRDDAQLHNTNRGLLLFPSDTEWSLTRPRPKAACVAERTGADHFVGWYDEWEAQKRGPRPDLILPLANERGVRAAVGQRGEPVLVHATTSSTWEAQLHRHVPHVDDCITCRMRDAESATSRFACSEAPVPVTASSDESNDAALPFLSAASGLLLLVGLLRMQAGLARPAENLWRLNFQRVGQVFRRARVACATGCQSSLPPNVLAALNQGRRWS
ncbi:MAG: hypothetical protein M9894_17665 [Planctomycetes bacterium]|nr:hypothetical protein [Planctomycetota bacterium]